MTSYKDGTQHRLFAYPIKIKTWYTDTHPVSMYVA